ncbi:hypothetical protein FF36_01748 [Frankia torreyi]|uniref:Uncharacterized protein n=1 Tax=Frankia torreyi TaxID=1856 RepID=A0A0D8BIC7_9ACTN|nr:MULTISPECIES: hypothetical protein [Frankia]KJE23815.1 hypothetical protein FF36_01748 [Frankia torreyi]KQC36339.1 hypothetical protein UK82_22025 [Frankia sp. ACN1ag]KQM05724.1 hypothetical protein FF86_10139 [Frankia sp. CpI1-P]
MPHQAGRFGRHHAPRRRAAPEWPDLASRWAPAAALALSVALVSAFVAGCGGTRSSAPAAVAAVRPPVLLDGAALHLPLDRYLLSPRESASVARAYRALLAQCTRRFGLPDPRPRPVASDLPATLNERRYGITDAALAATAGYRVSKPRPAGEPPTPAESATTPDPGTLDILTGRHPGAVDGRPIPAGGCAGEAKRRLNAGAPAGTDPDLAQRLSQTSYFASGRDGRVQEVLRAWSACMGRHGLHYSSPLDAAADPRFRTGPVSATETAVAATDITCKKQTNLVGVWFDVESELQRPDLAANRKALEGIRQTNQIQLTVARGLGLG